MSTIGPPRRAWILPLAQDLRTLKFSVSLLSVHVLWTRLARDTCIISRYACSIILKS